MVRQRPTEAVAQFFVVSLRDLVSWGDLEFFPDSKIWDISKNPATFPRTTSSDEGIRTGKLLQWEKFD